MADSTYTTTENTPVDAPKTVGTLEAAKMMGVTYATLNRYLKRGYITFVRLPSGHKRIPVEEIFRAQKEANITP